MKAYKVYPKDNQYDTGCILVYATSRNKAKYYTYIQELWLGYDYIDYTALRCKDYDKFCVNTHLITPYHIETNEELPTEAPKFFDAEI